MLFTSSCMAHRILTLFRVLKAWLILRHAGRRAYVAAVENNIHQAGVLKRALDDHPSIETMTYNLSIVTFRYAPKVGVPDASPKSETYLNHLNAAILTRIQIDDEAHISNSIRDGQLLLWACTTEDDVRALPEIIAREGQRAIAEIAVT
jgi:aromatic-L-amino-acid decarboxylase